MKSTEENKDKTWFGRLFDGAFWRRKKPVKIPDISTQNFEGIGEFQFTAKYFKNKQDFLTEITNQGKAFRKKGQEDGQDGIHPSAMKRVAESIADQWQSFIESTFKSKYTAALERKEVAEDDLENKKKYQIFQIANKEIIENYYRYNSKDFNLGMGIFYLIASILLLAADYPLSLQTVRDGFSILDNEGVLLAIGIVLMTIYIKIIYDEYLGNSVSKTLLEYRKQNLFGDQPEASDAEVRKARIIRIAIGVVKLSILVLLIVTIVALGMYRFEVNAARLASSSTSGSSNLAQSLQSQLSFVLISLVLPIVGGVCASLGLKRVQNWMERFNINRKNGKAARKKEKALKVLINAEEKLKEYEEYVKWSSDESFLRDCSEYFFSCYLNGYDKGAKNNISTDLFGSASKIRRNMNSLQSTKVIIQKSGQSGTGNGWHDEYYPKN